MDNSDIYAANWVPSKNLLRPDGKVGSEFIWAALDCPGTFAISGDPSIKMVLGTFKAHINHLPRFNDRCIVLAWHIESLGRKHRSGTVLYNKGGDLLAFTDALWISLIRKNSQKVHLKIKKFSLTIILR